MTCEVVPELECQRGPSLCSSLPRVRSGVVRAAVRGALLIRALVEKLLRFELKVCTSAELEACICCIFNATSS
jgi:hypothetical protein